MDILDLNQFYARTDGRLARQSVISALSKLWQPIQDERLGGFGYAVPYLDAFGEDAERVVNFMPAALGSMLWPPGRANRTCLVFEEDLPLADSVLDRFLIVHGFEHCENPGESLQEIWRVLAPNGRLVLVVPNRIGLWAGIEKTPFGSGRPWTGRQLTAELRKALFEPAAWSSALHFPPSRNRLALKCAPGMERFGRRFMPAFGGVLIVEAIKRVYQGIPVKAKQSRRIFVPVLAPQNIGHGKKSVKRALIGGDCALKPLSSKG